jgi:hypothetical protein
VTAQTATLADFLLARIAEDEAVAREIASYDPSFGWGSNGFSRHHEAFGERFIPDRVLAECEAKRRIVALHPIDGSLRGPVTDNKFDVCACGPDLWPVEERPNGKWGYVPEPENGDFYPCGTLKALALPYADHPDFRPEWRA